MIRGRCETNLDGYEKAGVSQHFVSRISKTRSTVFIASKIYIEKDYDETLFSRKKETQIKE